MDAKTHLEINTTLNGRVTSIGDQKATVQLDTTADMTADAEGLVHGGFLFGAADYAAMMAVNDPNVVLAGAEVRFRAPVALGQTVLFHARITERAGRKRIVEVVGSVGEQRVFTGTFTTAILDQHVLTGVV